MGKITKALKKARGTGKPVDFSHWEGDKSNGFSGSKVGQVWPCGCIIYQTILSDGSLGWGSWTEQCDDCLISLIEESA